MTTPRLFLTLLWGLPLLVALQQVVVGFSSGTLATCMTRRQLFRLMSSRTVENVNSENESGTRASDSLDNSIPRFRSNLFGRGRIHFGNPLQKIRQMVVGRRLVDRDQLGGLQPEHEVECNRLRQPIYFSGERLHRLRNCVMRLRDELYRARYNRDSSRTKQLERAIAKALTRDPEYRYPILLQRMKELQCKQSSFLEDSTVHEELEKYRRDAAVARQALPQFNLAGLWQQQNSGRALPHNTINITYIGDILIAQRMGRESHDPTVKMIVDLGCMSNAEDKLLALPYQHAVQVGSCYAKAFPGVGYASADVQESNDEQGRSTDWLQGQFLLLNEYSFAFVWLDGYQEMYYRLENVDQCMETVSCTQSHDLHERNQVADRGKCSGSEMKVWDECDQAFFYDRIGYFE